MQVASLDLCKELYELSGWKKTYFAWAVANEGDYEPWLRPATYSNHAYTEWAAYDLGYLLRKLPDYVRDDKNRENAPFELRKWKDKYTAEYHQTFSPPVIRIEHYDTPENALCKLAIQLFKQNILTPENE